MDNIPIPEDPDWQAICRGLLNKPGVSLTTLAQTANMSKSGIKRLRDGATIEPKYSAGLRLIRFNYLLNKPQ